MPQLFTLQSKSLSFNIKYLRAKKSTGRGPVGTVTL